MTNGFGTPVRARDGREIGTIDRLILDPARNEVTAAVLRKGLLLHRDVEVPLSLLRRSHVGDLRVDLTPGEIDQLPTFQEARYTHPPPGYIPPSGYPGENFYWPKTADSAPPPDQPGNGAAVAPPSAERGALSRQDLEQAVIRKGSPVAGRDGRSVGRVFDVQFNPESGRLTGLIIRTGSLVPRDWELTSLLIAGVRDGVVYLKVDASQLMT